MNRRAQNLHANRRDFFRYAAGGALLTTTATYSPPSHAFAFTAAAILTGEKIGWAAYPPMQLGKKFVEMKYREMVRNSTATEIQTVYKGKDALIQALEAEEETEYGRKIEPITNFCSYSDAAKSSLKKRNRRKMLTNDLNNANSSGNPAITSTSEIGLGLSKYLDNIKPVNYTDINQMSKSFNKLGVYRHLISKPHYLEIPVYFRQQLLKSALNHELTSKLTNFYQSHNDKIDATYHSEKWREKLNNTSAEITLCIESVSQKAEENALLFDLLMAKQNTLLIRCLETIALLEKGQSS